MVDCQAVSGAVVGGFSHDFHVVRVGLVQQASVKMVMEHLDKTIFQHRKHTVGHTFTMLDPYQMDFVSAILVTTQDALTQDTYGLVHKQKTTKINLTRDVKQKVAHVDEQY